MATKRIEVPPGYKLIFRPYITDPKTGKRKYPVNSRCFPILVKA
ncbi:hypothetical protein PDESU_05581 [Pontiella desulfatans]|jgi:hypothetical protein|uniref:Uncharacterized protein n=1 Tax=Pontiella desulfatans TaxID=2750659 RepID=A0A6C2UBH9_PONDE|nr:hypothetical protein PDESU_05581 [Pontiella desulfatans]